MKGDALFNLSHEKHSSDAVCLQQEENCRVAARTLGDPERFRTQYYDDQLIQWNFAAFLDLSLPACGSNQSQLSHNVVTS